MPVEEESVDTGKESSTESELENKKKAILTAVGITIFVLIILFVVFNSSLGDSFKEDVVVVPDVQRDLGGIIAAGGGLPGYDIDANGEADYIESGFANLIKIYNEGGFDYPGGWVYIKELPREDIQRPDIQKNLTFPSIHFSASDLTESNIGSVISFVASEEESSLEILVIYRTLGRQMNTYTVVITNSETSFRITDRLGGQGVGTFEHDEIELLGPSIPTF